MLNILFSLAFTLLYFESVSGHAVYLTYPYYCANQPLVTGTTIMDSSATNDILGRTITVMRGATKLSSQAYYIGGEILNVTVSVFSLDIAIEATGLYIYFYVIFKR